MGFSVLGSVTASSALGFAPVGRAASGWPPTIKFPQKLETEHRSRLSVPLLWPKHQRKPPRCRWGLLGGTEEQSGLLAGGCMEKVGTCLGPGLPLGMVGPPSRPLGSLQLRCEAVCCRKAFLKLLSKLAKLALLPDPVLVWSRPRCAGAVPVLLGKGTATGRFRPQHRAGCCSHSGQG